jgi:SAM-dependent methyltransferase
MMGLLQRRDRRPERMDEPGLDPVVHERALAGLGRINRVSRTAAAMWREIRGLAATANGRPVRVLDLACGGGDVALALSELAQAAKLPLEVCGCDASAAAVQFACAASRRRGTTSVEFRQVDVLREPLPDGYDVICAALFLHHLSDGEALQLLQRMRAAAGRLVLISDLRRSALGFVFAWAGCRLLSRSSVVHEDGPLSVRAAFRTPEARELAMQAGLRGARVEECWPQRFMLIWRRDDA